MIIIMITVVVELVVVVIECDKYSSKSYDEIHKTFKDVCEEMDIESKIPTETREQKVIHAVESAWAKGKKRRSMERNQATAHIVRNQRFSKGVMEGIKAGISQVYFGDRRSVYDGTSKLHGQKRA
jgi:hypothetical protein